MNLIEAFIAGYQEILHCIAEIAVHTLELIGILIIMVGSVKAIALVVSHLRRKKPVNVVITLGKALSLALEFKMGAEIINTVVVRDLKELGVLAVVVLIRALLATLIHWDMKMEQSEAHHESEKKDK